MGQSTGGVPVFTGNPKTIHHHYNSIVAGVFRSHVTTLFGAMTQMENRLPAFAWAALRTSAHEGWVKPINIVTCHVETLKSLRLLTIYDFIKKEPLKIIRFMPVVSGQPSCLVDDDPALSSKRMPVTLLVSVSHRLLDIKILRTAWNSVKIFLTPRDPPTTTFPSG